IWIAQATDAADLIVGRIIVGVGCAASFMSVVFLCARWFSARELSTALSWVFAASNLGTLAGATPLAWVASEVGWRNGFLGLSAVTLVVAVLFYVVVRDRPPDSTLPTTHKEPLHKVFAGLWQVWRTKGLLPLLSMHFFAYATMLTVLGVWGGPYLFDVHHLDGVQRGNVLLAMGVAQTLGILTYGPMDRVLRSRKKAVILGTYLTAAVLLALSVIALLVAVCFLCAFGTVIVAQGRTLFPDRLGGRAVTTVNMAQCLGLTVLPALTGYIVEAWGANDLAYRLVLGSLAYFRAPDNVSS